MNGSGRPIWQACSRPIRKVPSASALEPFPLNSDIRVVSEKLRHHGINVLHDRVSSVKPAEQIDAFAPVTAKRKMRFARLGHRIKLFFTDRAVMRLNHLILCSFERTGNGHERFQVRFARIRVGRRQKGSPVRNFSGSIQVPPRAQENTPSTGASLCCGILLLERRLG